MSQARYKGGAQSTRWLATLLLLPLSQLAASPDSEVALAPRDAERLLGLPRQHGLRLEDIDTADLTPTGVLQAVRSATRAQPSAEPQRLTDFTPTRIDRTTISRR